MSAKYEVALVRVGSEYPPEIAVRGGGIFDNKWYVGGPRFGSQHGWTERQLQFVRPLVVLDPDDRKQIERLMRVVRDNAFESGDSYPGMGRFADAMQAALRSQIKPPKPAEPTVRGAVVADASGLEWVRIHPAGPAWVNGYERWATWDDIDAVKVVRP